MNLVKVTAATCSQDGKNVSQANRTEMYLSKDLIAAIRIDSISLKGNSVLMNSGMYFTDFKLASGVNVDTI
mgnify:CR=1 FL=1